MSKKFNDYLRIKEAAAYVGVTESTLRNWEKAKKMTVYRHPVNSWRLYNKDDLDTILGEVKQVEEKYTVDGSLIGDISRMCYWTEELSGWLEDSLNKELSGLLEDSLNEDLKQTLKRYVLDIHMAGNRVLRKLKTKDQPDDLECFYPMENE